jgi:phospholipid/cholesterol/gamma-HCH transport system permease protein
MGTIESTNMKTKSEISFSRLSDDALLIHFSGDWILTNSLPSADEVQKQIESEAKIKRITFDTETLKKWDSGFLTFLISILEQCTGKGIVAEEEGLPKGVQRLLRLATAVPERKGARRGASKIPFLERVADTTIDAWRSLLDMLNFIGEASVAFGRLLVGKARFRRSELFNIIQASGADALPIVSLISFLVGLILAFIGAIQLKIFGAQIYVASLVGIGMVRALAAVMTGIIMAGRTGASFAAQLGTMQVNEEIDALQTLGISPMEFLVLPRMLALFIMMPLLSIYANLMGILGGLFIGVSMLGLNFMEYYNKTRESVSLNDFWVGVISAAVFGILVALAGCLRGIQCGRSASAVGEATTSAVVTSIVSIVVATAIITVITNVLGI